MAAIVAAGGTGEMYSLTPSENLEVVRTVVEGWRAYSGDQWHRVQRRYGSGSRSPVGEHGRWPCYPNSDDEGLAECYAAIVSATPLRLFVYRRDWVNPSIACLLGGFLSDRQVRLRGRR